jgi:aminoglycoside phosphotransferase (APT) family kinase protein
MAHATTGHGEIDAAAIATVARDLMGGQVRDVRALTGGISNLTYLVRLSPPADPGAVVVRLFAHRGRARAEMAALRMLDGTEVPAPQFLGHGRIRGAGWFVVSTRVPGRPAARPDDPNWLDGLAATLAAIHGVPPHGRGLTLDPDPACAWIDDRPSLELGPIAQTLWPMLERRRHELALGRTVLVHGDFHSGNVHWVGPRIAGVIDWETARWGPAAADVAYCYMDLTLAAGRRTAQQFLAAYVNRAGDAPGFDAWLLLATLRPLPDPARWLPSYEGAGWQDLTPTLLRRRLAMLARSLAGVAPRIKGLRKMQ